MKLKTPLCLAILAIVSTGPLAAQQAEEIAMKHAAACAAELEAYLKTNPDEEERYEAMNHLLNVYDLMDNPERIIAILKEKFASLVAEDADDPDELLVTTEELFRLLMDGGDKKAATDVITRATTKLKDFEDAAEYAEDFQAMAESLKAPDVGESVELKFKSLQGEDIDLAKMKGKVVLLDFWATWCGPCIAELPHVKKAYAEYHDKGFEVIGISLDKEEDKEKLMKFLEREKIAWPQHFEGHGEENSVAAEFGVTGIPATFLIDRDGKLVAKELRGEFLSEEIGRHLAKEPSVSE